MTVQERFAYVCAQIQNARAQSPYAQEVTLLAATKTVDAQTINLAARECALTDIGENRVQELLSKYDALDKERLRIHFIGSLQTNKVKYIIDKVDMIHSVDSEKLANEIEKQAARIGRVMPVLVEINSAREESKSGIVPERAIEFLTYLQTLPHLQVCGLMTLGKKTQNYQEKCDIFTKTYQLFLDGKEKRLYNISRPILSMGMSDSFCEAILCGSTLVRVGTALFGARAYPQREDQITKR